MPDLGGIKLEFEQLKARLPKDESWVSDILELSERAALKDLTLAMEVTQFAHMAHEAGEEPALSCEVRVGELSFRLGQADQAREAFDTGIKKADRIQAPLLKLKCLSGLGAIEVLRGNQRKAIEYMTAAVRIGEELNDQRALMSLYNNLGVCYERQGDFPESLKSLISCLRLEVHDRRIEAAVLHNIANCYMRLEEYTLALEYSDRSLEIVEEIGLLVGRAMRLNLKAQIHVQQGDIDKAIPHVNDALDLSHSLDDASERAHALATLAQIALLKNDRERATTLLEEAVDCSKEAADIDAHIRALLLMGQAHAGDKDFETARASYLEARTLAKQQGNRVQESSALEGLSVCYANTGEHDLAYDFLRRFHKLHKEVEGYRVEQRIRAVQIEADLDAARADVEAFRTKTRALQEANQTLEAYQLQNEALLAQLRRQNREDHLTGLNNRRYFDEVLSQEWYRAKRYGRPLALAMADVDHFKRVNDLHSHQVGDIVLQQVAEILRSRVRQTDLVARYGGEEFVILFPEATIEEARLCCDDICQSIERFDWDSLGCHSPVTISIGLADDADSAEQILAAADEKLYQAKASGRNRVVVSSS